MDEILTGDQLRVGVADFLTRLWHAGVEAPEEILAVAARSGLVPSQSRESDGSVSLTFDSSELDAAFERKLRLATTRALGKPTGTDKHWDIDTFQVHLSATDRRVRLHLRQRYAIARARSAARAWLGGQDAASWGVEYGFPGEGERPRIGLFFRSGEGRAPTASISLSAGTRPVGTFPASDDEAYQLLVDYLSAEIGEAGPGTTAISPYWFAWRAGGRRVDVKRSRGTRSRTVGFHQDA